LPVLRGKHRAKSVSPKSNRLMSDIDAAFMQKIFHIPQRERKPHIHHNGQVDDLGARLKVTKGRTFCHPETLGGGLPASRKLSLTAQTDFLCQCQLDRCAGLCLTWRYSVFPEIYRIDLLARSGNLANNRQASLEIKVEFGGLWKWNM
jgi:hypothetical protein